MAEQQLSAEEVLGVMRACHDRRLEREGIPMILGLDDLRGDMPGGGEAERAEGVRIAAAVDRYRGILAPWASDDDEGALILAMQVAAVTHFAPVEPGDRA